MFEASAIEGVLNNGCISLTSCYSYHIYHLYNIQVFQHPVMVL